MSNSNLGIRINVLFPNMIWNWYHHVSYVYFANHDVIWVKEFAKNLIYGFDLRKNENIPFLYRVFVLIIRFGLGVVISF